MRRTPDRDRARSRFDGATVKPVHAFAHLVREWHALMAAAEKLKGRDPEAAEILRTWAQEKARALCEARPGTLDAALSALLSAGVEMRDVKKFSKNKTRLRGRNGKKNPDSFSGG